MAQRTGRLKINQQGNSILNGIRLAIRGAGNPLRDATNHIRSSGFNHNSFITASGDDGFLGNIPVFYITNVAAAVADSSVSAFNFEIADESSGRAATAEMLQHKRNEEEISSKTDLKGRGRRKKGNVLVVAGGVAIVAGIVLLILSRRASENR